MIKKNFLGNIQGLPAGRFRDAPGTRMHAAPIVYTSAGAGQNPRISRHWLFLSGRA
jgi:tetraacyldisaccharide-1-P 4'-kinase